MSRITSPIKKGNFGKVLEKFHKEIATPENILQAFDCLIQHIALWNSELALVFLTFNSALKVGVNVISKRKAEKRIVQIVETIEKLHKKQQAGETNYEAALICPELFRNVLIIEDEDRVKELLAFIEMLFISDKLDFDRLAEALRLVNQLSSMEYKILKLIPLNATTWKEMLEKPLLQYLYNTQKQQLTAAFLSLINKNLVVRKLGIKHDGGPELGTISFNDDIEYVRLSPYGELFLETMEEIKAQQDDL